MTTIHEGHLRAKTPRNLFAENVLPYRSITLRYVRTYDIGAIQRSLMHTEIKAKVGFQK